MTVSGLISLLQGFLPDGDDDVVIDDADTRGWGDEPGYLLAVKRVRRLNGRVLLSGNYHDTENPEPTQ